MISRLNSNDVKFIKATKSAILIPYEKIIDSYRFLMTQRNYWNYSKNSPMRFPGEWVFPGGKLESKDSDLKRTAIRKFEEKTFYVGQIEDMCFYKSITIISEKDNEEVNFIEAYMGKIYRMHLGSNFNIYDEVINVNWMSVSNWLEYLKSDTYEAKHNQALESLGIKRERATFMTEILEDLLEKKY